MTALCSTTALRRGSSLVAMLAALGLISTMSADAATSQSVGTRETTASKQEAVRVAMEPVSLTPPPANKTVRRAQSWVNAHVAYNSSRSYTNRFGTYRQDCSGYVSLAWRLGSSYTTSTLPNLSHHVRKSALRRGDVLLHTATARTSGHVVLFDAWANPAHSSYLAYEQTPDGGARHHTLPYPYWDGHGTYSPYRRDGT